MTYRLFDWSKILPGLKSQSQQAVYSARGECGQCGQYSLVVFLAMSGGKTARPGLLSICPSCLVATAKAMQLPIDFRPPVKTIYSRLPNGDE